MAAGLRVSFLNKFCEQFDLEGYDEVHIQGPAGEIVLNQEGITLIGNVYVEGHLRKTREQLMG